MNIGQDESLRLPESSSAIKSVPPAATVEESTRIALESALPENLVLLGAKRYLARTVQLASLRLGREREFAPSAMRERSLLLPVQVAARTAHKESGTKKGTPTAMSVQKLATAFRLGQCVPSARWALTRREEYARTAQEAATATRRVRTLVANPAMPDVSEVYATRMRNALALVPREGTARTEISLMGNAQSAGTGDMAT